MQQYNRMLYECWMLGMFSRGGDDDNNERIMFWWTKKSSISRQLNSMENGYGTVSVT